MPTTEKMTQRLMVERMYHELYENGAMKRLTNVEKVATETKAEVILIRETMVKVVEKQDAIESRLQEHIASEKDEKIKDLEIKLEEKDQNLETEEQRRNGKRNYYIALAGILTTIFGALGGLLWWAISARVEVIVQDAINGVMP